MAVNKDQAITRKKIVVVNDTSFSEKRTRRGRRKLNDSGSGGPSVGSRERLHRNEALLLDVQVVRREFLAE
jgi:hypothetical protein